MEKPQVLLEQAEACIDAALDDVLRSRNMLMEAGLSAFTLGQINNKLAEAIGELHTCRRLMPGYQRNGNGHARGD